MTEENNIFTTPSVRFVRFLGDEAGGSFIFDDRDLKWGYWKSICVTASESQESINGFGLELWEHVYTSFKRARCRFNTHEKYMRDWLGGKPVGSA